MTTPRRRDSHAETWPAVKTSSNSAAQFTYSVEIAPRLALVESLAARSMLDLDGIGRDEALALIAKIVQVAQLHGKTL